MKVLTQIECPFVTMNTLLQRAVTGWVRFWRTSDSSFCVGLHFLDRTGSGSARECWFWQSLVAKRFQCQLLAVSHSLYMFYCGNGHLRGAVYCSKCFTLFYPTGSPLYHVEPYCTYFHTIQSLLELCLMMSHQYSGRWVWGCTAFSCACRLLNLFFWATVGNADISCRCEI